MLNEQELNINSDLNDLIIAKNFAQSYTWAGDSTGTVNVPYTVPDGYKFMCACDAVSIGRGATCGIQTYVGLSGTVPVYWSSKGTSGGAAGASIKVLCLFIKEMN